MYHGGAEGAERHRGQRERERERREREEREKKARARERERERMPATFTYHVRRDVRPGVAAADGEALWAGPPIVPKLANGTAVITAPGAHPTFTDWQPGGGSGAMLQWVAEPSAWTPQLAVSPPAPGTSNAHELELEMAP